MNDDSFEDLLQELLDTIEHFIEESDDDLSEDGQLTVSLATPYDTIH